MVDLLCKIARKHLFWDIVTARNVIKNIEHIVIRPADDNERTKIWCYNATQLQITA